MRPFLRHSGLTVDARLDGRGVFKKGFARLEENLNARYYTSVVTFSEDFGAAVKAGLAAAASLDSKGVNTVMNGEFANRDLTHDYKHKKILANRIIKAVKGLFEDALRLEGEMCQKSFEKEIQNLDKLLENSIISRRDSINGSRPTNGENEAIRHQVLTNEAGSKDHNDDSANQMDVDSVSATASHQLLSTEEPSQDAKESPSNKPKNKRQQPTPELIPAANGLIGDERRPSIRGGSTSHHIGKVVQLSEPPTPPMSSEGESQQFSQGGIPWYMEPFDPSGTTIAEERWTGRDLVRGMSEDLSDMDEEELSGLVDVDDMDGGHEAANEVSEQQAAQAAESAEKKRKAAKRRRWRGFR